MQPLTHASHYLSNEAISDPSILSDGSNKKALFTLRLNTAFVIRGFI